MSRGFIGAGFGVTIIPESIGALGMVGGVYGRQKGRRKLMAPRNLACPAVNHSVAARQFVAMVPSARPV
jgi:hypothetical protein